MPKPKNGKVCYIEMPAMDGERCADFYKKVFGWQSGAVETVHWHLTTAQARLAARSF